MDNLDPDFKRLMEGEAQIGDLPIPVQQKIRARIRSRELDLDSIPDASTRETLKRWVTDLKLD